MSNTSNSQALFARATARIPGGVNSPVRAFKGVGGTPLFFKSGSGAMLEDVDGNRYIDYVGSWGPLILGHAFPSVIQAIQETARHGTSFGAPTALEVEMAETLCRLLPHVEEVRLVNSGTEATMSALRLARAFTQRDKIIKFAGCYHGHSDSLLVQAGSGALTCGVPTSPGVLSDAAAHTLIADYNDLNQVEALIAKYPSQIAAIIVEPVAGNMGFIRPKPEFLPGLRKLCSQHGILLIIDEVMTGFRVGLQGACGHFDITPDLSTWGKVIGGGMPLAAFGGRKDIMEQMAPSGPVYQAGTLSGNPVAVAAGLATLAEIQKPGFYAALTEKTQQLCQGLKTAATAAGIPFWVDSIGGMFGFFFHPGPVQTYAEALQCNQNQFKCFFHAMLENGVYLAPSAFEAGFMSMAHGTLELDATLKAAQKAFAQIGDLS